MPRKGRHKLWITDISKQVAQGQSQAMFLADLPNTETQTQRGSPNGKTKKQVPNEKNKRILPKKN